jgi:hydrogenase maturation factor HypE
VYGQVVDDIHTRLSSFPNFVIQHVSRGANSAAHTLAKLALTLPSDVVRMECPLPINSIVHNELSSSD